MLDSQRDLMLYRLEMAQGRLEAAKLLLDNGNYKDSIGRSYYAIFTAVRALLAVEGTDYSKHSGVISHFQREYIKTGIFEKKYSKYISMAFQLRNNTDYADFFIVAKADAEEQYKHAMEMYDAIKMYITSL